MTLRIRYLPAIVAALAAVTLAVAPSGSRAAAATSCQAPAGLGAKTPVILVHGFTGSPGDWGDPSQAGSMYHAILQVPDLYVETFDWSDTNTSWVTNPNEGPRLADRIDCLARASAGNGGLGKVILVDHSMGGLITRYASSFVVGGHRISPEIGFVVTIGTPNLGSGWANASDPLVATICSAADASNPWRDADTSFCPDYSALQGMSKHSQQIANLPWLPAGIPLRAIAGDTTLTAPLLHSLASDDTHSDLVVGVDSALGASHSPEPLDDGAGDMAYPCTESVVNWKQATCWHVGLLSNPDVQREVAASIRAYLRNGPWEPFMTGGGNWYVHGTSKFQVVPHGTSSATWNLGPCTIPPTLDSTGQPIMCNTNIEVHFHPVNYGLLGEITRVWYTTGSGVPLPDGFKSPEGEPVVGQSFGLTATKYPHVLKAVYTANSPSGLRQGNPYLCQKGTPQRLLDQGICGA